MELTTLIYEQQAGIGQIKLNRPQVLNALNQTMVDELGTLLGEIALDSAVKVIVVTGGEEVFAAGADIAHMSEALPLEGFEFARSTQTVLNKLAVLEKPVLAAISGYALGGGLELALACDLRIASETAKFGLPEITLGIIPGGGGTQRLPRLVGEARAKELIFTGQIIDAVTADKIGLINRVVPKGQALPEALKVAGKIAGMSKISLGMAKTAINLGLQSDLATGMASELQCFALLFSTQDQKEGMQAFLQKRKPVFRDR